MNSFIYMKNYVPFTELPEIKIECNLKRESGLDEMKARQQERGLEMKEKLRKGQPGERVGS